MKINNLDTNRMRNDAHFQFHADFIALVNGATAEALKIAALWTAHAALFAKLDEALKKIVMSAATPKIREADKERDELFSGFKKLLAGLCEHFDPAIRDAALNVQVVVHTYGNVAAKSLSEETSAVYNLVQELKTAKYSGLIGQLNLTQYLNKIEMKNIMVSALIQERDRDNASKTHVAVVEARRALDGSYKHIVDIINANLLLGQLAGAEAEEFVNTANETIHRYASMRHKHRHGAHGGESSGDGAGV
jgi:hypothetical protein